MKHRLLFLFCVILVLFLGAVSCRRELSPLLLSLTQTALAPQVQTRVAAEMQTSSPIEWNDLLTEYPTSPVSGGLGASPTPRSTTANAAGTATRSQPPPATWAPEQPTFTPTVTPVPGQPTLSATKTQVPGQPTWTNTSAPTLTRTLAVPTSTATNTPTRTATVKPTATKTATPQTGWGGEWTVYMEQADGSALSGPLIITLNGTDLIASAALGGDQYNFEGFLFNEGQYATGSWAGSTSAGYFWWSLLPGAQFGGCLDVQYAFCAARPGGTRPDPCLFLPPR